MKNSEPGRKKPMFTYTLRSAFIIGTVVAVALCIFKWRAEQQRQIVKWVRDNGGNVTYSDQIDRAGNYLGDAQPNSLERFFGRDAIASVRQVFLDNQELDNIDPLSRLSCLESLHLNSTLKNYHSLPSCRSLKLLSVSNISKQNISVIAKMVWLEDLYLDNCSCELDALSSLSNLKFIEIQRCETIDLNQIVKLDLLERLDLSMVKIKSLTPLTKATNLKVVNLTDVTIVEKSDGIADLQKKIPGCAINEIILGPF